MFFSSNISYYFLAKKKIKTDTNKTQTAVADLTLTRLGFFDIK